MAILQSVRDKLLIYSAGKCAKCKRDLLIEGYKIFEKSDNSQLLLVSKTKNTIISFAA